MLFNFLKIAFRNLLKSKGFSAINIIGLAIGMASAILILLWIGNETSYDNFHEKKDRIYEAWNLAHFSGELHAWNTTPKILSKALQSDLPEIETTVRVNWPSYYLMEVGDKKISVTGNIVDSTFLDVFTFPLLKGNPKQALMDPSSILITEELAMKLFGTKNVLGQTIKLDNKNSRKVTAVLKTLPKNTRFTFEYLLPWSYMRTFGGDDDSWGNNSTRNYALLKPGASIASANAKMKVLKPRYDKEEPKWQMFLYPISRWRLHSNFENGKESGGLIEYVKIFGMIAAFILLIACINFMNLSTARSEQRAKEVGIRRVIGALKSNLIGQFLGESVLISLISGLIALVIVQLALPGFNQLTEKSLSIPYSNPVFWLQFFGFVILTGFIAGSYPAFYLSSFRPTSVLKGTFRKVNALITPRKALVVLQFTFATILILSTIVVRRQLQHAQDRQAGYNKDNLIYHHMTGDIEKNFLLIKQELLSTGAAVSVTKSSAPLSQGWSNSWGFEWAGKSPNDKTLFDKVCADEHLATTAGLQMVKGRDFNLTEFPTDSTGVLLNESAAKAMAFKEPIGQIVKDDGIDWHVVGVFKDFILGSPFYPTNPMVIEGAKGWFNVIHFKMNSKNKTADNIAKAETIFRKYNAQFPFEYKFIDEDYAAKFENEKRIATLAALFAGLTIFISCLGLFGLATYMTATRIKEIGVRKVLGASVGSIAGLLSKDFIKLVLVAFCIGSPIAWYAMYRWLEGYPYRTSIEWWLFVLTGTIAIAIALATVSFQAIKAAVMNPVKSLRSE